MDRLQANRVKFLDGMKASLELLKSDLALRREGYEFFDVVDFAAMHAHVYKKSGLPVLAMEGEPDAVVAARSQMALQLLFTEYPRPLLLIPPYSDELKNHFDRLATTMQIAEVDVSLERNRSSLMRLIESSDAFKTFLNTLRPGLGGPRPAMGAIPGAGEHDGAGDKAGTGTSLARTKSAVADEEAGIKTFLDVARPDARDSQLRSAALDAAREFFPELYAVTVALPSEARSQFLALFREKTLQDADEVLHDFRDFEYDEDSVDRWFKAINDRRKGERAFATRTDAMACTYIEKVNARLNEKPKLVVFISPSESVSRALSDGLVLSDGVNSALAVVRDLTYCVMAATHKGDLDKSEEEINKSLARVGQLRDVYASAIPVNWQNRQKREQAALEWKWCENLFLVSGPNIIDTANRRSTSDREAKFLALVAEIHTAGTEGRESLLRELESDRNKLKEEIAELNKLIPGLEPGKAYDKYLAIHMQPRKGSRVEFPELPDEIPVRVAFRDRSTIGAAQFLSRQVKGTDRQEAVSKLRLFVLDLASKPTATPEQHLLAGYLLAMEERYETALEELQNGLAKLKDEPIPELKLVTAMVLRKLNRAREAIELLEGALKDGASDDRVRLELANSLWLRWRERPDALHTHGELNQAIDHLNAARRSFSGHANSGRPIPLLKAQVENLAAFVHTERALVSKPGQDKDLAAASRCLKEMSGSLPQDKWSARFFDTRGYLHYAQARLLCGSIPEEDRRELLISAARDLETALKSDEATLKSQEDLAVGPRIRLQHKKLIDAELAGIGI